jgi:malate dehydrogenase
VDTIYPIGDLTDFEKEGLAAMMPELLASIEKGVSFAKGT